MYNYIFLHFVALIICNICLLFAPLFIFFHVDHDVTDASLYDVCFFIYSASLYVRKC